MRRFERVVALPDSKISDFPQPNSLIYGWIAGYGLQVFLSTGLVSLWCLKFNSAFSAYLCDLCV